ncbi:Cytochrome b-c1 complex subunit 7, partial [Trichinella pseudospiralis]
LLWDQKQRDRYHFVLMDRSQIGFEKKYGTPGRGDVMKIVLGLLWHDTYSEAKEIVEEAVRRLPPEEYDKRAIRLLRAAQLTLKHEYLPKDQWTKWEDETWYLKPHLDRIKREYRDYKTFTGRKPYWATRANYEQSEH